MIGATVRAADHEAGASGALAGIPGFGVKAADIIGLYHSVYRVQGSTPGPGVVYA